ncbi:hypothetical protein EfmAA96_13080 [Enterococcus faecium]|nr:hypothetical protein EfmAA96_13080 [Enterococcus faecium]
MKPTSFVIRISSYAFKSTLLAVVLSAVDVLFELSVDELEEVVLFAEQPAANSNAAAKLILKITLFFFITVPFQFTILLSLMITK